MFSVFTLSSALALVVQPSAAEFQMQMTSQILPSNFELRSYTFAISGSHEFSTLSQSTSALSAFLSKNVREICLGQNRTASVCDKASRFLGNAPSLEFSPTAAVETFSNWIYAVDGDNWYQFFPMKNVVEAYITNPDREFRFVPAFNAEGVLVENLSASGLPVVLNHDTKNITLWTLDLRD